MKLLYSIFKIIIKLISFFYLSQFLSYCILKSERPFWDTWYIRNRVVKCFVKKSKKEVFNCVKLKFKQNYAN